MNSQHSKQRMVTTIEALTPLIVPSFSSKGIVGVGNLHNYLKPYLSEASLISAYDLYHGFINQQNIYESHILFIDSGGYERIKDHDLSDIYGQEHAPKTWNMGLYNQQLAELDNLSQMVFVNYDSEVPVSIHEQVTVATNTFMKYPNVASDFLYKPTKENQAFIDIDSYCENVGLLTRFDILGFTEKELGASVLQRCCNIYKIRTELAEANLDTPIHVFGCIDPYNILVYFLCGADVFDGLSWLRFSFQDWQPTYFNSYAIVSGKWAMDDLDVKALSYAENLTKLNELKRRMVRFIETRDWNVFEFDQGTVMEIQKLLDEVETRTVKV